jgi:hypothetical protein
MTRVRPLKQGRRLAIRITLSKAASTTKAPPETSLSKSGADFQPLQRMIVLSQKGVSFSYVELLTCLEMRPGSDIPTPKPITPNTDKQP